MNLVIGLILFFIAYRLTGFIRSYALRKNIIDIPNERSAHKISTPVGGGVAVILVFMLALSWSVWNEMIPQNLFIALLGGCIVIAGLGYLDDMKGLSVYLRISVHFLAAIWALYWLGGFPSLQIGHWELVLGWLGTLLAAIGIVWFINFYNFMDGVDGLAASEGMVVSLGAGIAAWFVGAVGVAGLCFFLVAALAGFLIWNWPPAKIFLGDVGSGALGFIFAVLALYTANIQFLPITFWLILLAVFICDASFTLVHRVLRGEQWYKAHREHAYQRLVHNGKSHRFVTLAVQLTNLLILLPIAFFLLRKPDLTLWFFLLVILGFWSLWFRIMRAFP